MITVQKSSFDAQNHLKGKLLSRIQRGHRLVMMFDHPDSPIYNKTKAEAGLVTNHAGQFFVLPLVEVTTFSPQAKQNPRNPLFITENIRQIISQIDTADEVNNFFEDRLAKGESYKNPEISNFPNLLSIAPQGQYEDYGHPNLLLSDLATELSPRRTQSAYDADLDAVAHHFVVTQNFRTESDYTEEENAGLATYYITSHAALWAFNLTFTGSQRPETSRVRLPSSAWWDCQM